MSFGKGLIVGHMVTLRRFLRTFFVVGHRWADPGSASGGGHQPLDFWFGKNKRGEEPVVRQDDLTEGLFTVEYPDERLPVYERFRVLPMLVYDDADGNVRCTSCNICAKVCPPQCIWMVHAQGPDGKPVPLPEDFFIDMDVCMNCGLCSEYCPFDAIKMDHNFELSNYERHQTHIFDLQDLLVSSEFYAKTRTPPPTPRRRRRPSGARSRRRRTSGSRRPWASGRSRRRRSARPRRRSPRRPRRHDSEWPLATPRGRPYDVASPGRTLSLRQPGRAMIPTAPKPKYEPGTRLRVVQSESGSATGHGGPKGRRRHGRAASAPAGRR